MKAHHNTLKKAKSYGIEMTVVENEIEARKDGVTLASGLAGNIVLDQAIAKLNGGLPGLKVKAVKSEKLAKPEPKPAKLVRSRKVQEEIEDMDDGDPDEEDIEGRDHQEDGEEGDEGGGSIVKRRFREKYAEHGGNNGDSLAMQLSSAINVVDKEGKSQLDVAKARKVGEANQAWNENWLNLNPGQIRMCLGNRLRAKIRKGETVKWPR
jgi:hypothetical protein